ncbi:accessory Sec-dependent serine-rich glycoprotein adhesin, partial [Streptococcus sp. OMI750]
MQFKRSKGNFRETDRVVRFKLIKSGKNWLRASTAALGLFRVVRGQVEEMVIAEVPEDDGRLHKEGQQLLKGLVAIGTVFGGAVVATTAQAEEVVSLAPTVSETKQETLAEADSVILSKTSSLDSASASLSTSTSLSETASLSLSMSESTSISISGQESTSLASVSSESTQVLASESAVDESAATDEASLLEQNASEAELLQQIAGKYATQIPVPKRKAALEAVINKLQSEVTTSYRLVHTNAGAQAYAEQRDRLDKAVDEMMTTLTAAGFVGNSNINGKPAISAQLAPISEEARSSDEDLSISPEMDDRHGANVVDAPLPTSNVAKDPNLDKNALLTPEELAKYSKDHDLNRYTFAIWEFVDRNEKSLGYYATLSVDRSETNPDIREPKNVYFRIVKESDGSEVFSQTFQPNVRLNSPMRLPKEVLIADSPAGNNFIYSFGDASKPPYVTLQSFPSIMVPVRSVMLRDIYNVMDPSHQGQMLNEFFQVKVPTMWSQQSTLYRLVDPKGKWQNGLYKPTGEEEILAEYRQSGIEGQQYTASNARDIAGYVQVPVVSTSQNATTGIFDNSKVGDRRVELYGNAREHFIKSEVVTTNQNGDYILRYYVLDPSKINTLTSRDTGNEPVFDKYTLVYEKTFKHDVPGQLSDLGGTRKIESKNKDYFLNVTPRRVDEHNFELDVTGWFSANETVTYTDEKTGIAYTVPKPFTAVPKSPSLSKNTTMVVGEDATPQGADGFSRFKHTIKDNYYANPMTSVNYYYRKMTASESASQSQSFSTSSSISESESPTFESISRSQSESLAPASLSASQSESLVQASVFASQSDSLIQAMFSASQSKSLAQESLSASQSDFLVQTSIFLSQSESLAQELLSTSQSTSLVKSSESASRSESLVQESLSVSQSESQVQESLSVSQSESQVQESLSVSQSESLVQASVSSSQSESRVQASISASQSESQVQASVSASQSESLIKESTSVSQSESLVQESVSASQSESLVQESVSASQSESQVQESVSASQSESQVQASDSASQSESQVQSSVSASQSESQVQASTSASQSESQVQASTSASQSESQVKESVSASQSESQVQASISASQSESQVQESVSASQSESQVQASASASQSESLVQASVSASQSESQVQASISASQSESLVQASTSASQSELQAQASISASQSESQVQASVSTSQSESQVQASTSASQSESLVQASVSASQSESQVQASISASQSESQVQSSTSASQSESQVQASISASQSESL